MYMKILLLCLLTLSSPGSIQGCSDSKNYSWSASNGEAINCEFLVSSSDKAIIKQRQTKWCLRTVKGINYMDKSEAMIKDKCPVACDTCCVSECADKSDFKWRVGSTTVDCGYLSTPNRKSEFCLKMVQGLGSTYDDGECRVQSKCAQKCSNCCD